MRLAAYVLLGDPAWLVPSIRSYYDHVDVIVASYDENYRSWAGFDLGPQIRQCIRLIEANDPDNKVLLAPGMYCRPDLHPSRAETMQRQAALNCASEVGAWVLQLDTDEVALNPERIVKEIAITDRLGNEALEFPARWVLSHVFGTWYVERASRLLRSWDGIPGAVAVRANAELLFCRQTESTRALRFATGPNHGTVALEDAILHFTSVRSRNAVTLKMRMSGHAPDINEDRYMRAFDETTRRPLRAIARSMFHRSDGALRLARLPERFGVDTVAREIAAGDPESVSWIDRGWRGLPQ